jgi:hypothetical protein
MKAKLIKTEVNYLLEGEGSVVIASTSLKKEGMSLSLRNCQAIERGYDLDEIKRKLFGGFDGLPDSFTIAAVERTIQIMVELMGNKKFSEEDVISMIEKSRETGLTAQFLILTKQQTEWDVEIRMEEIHFGGGCYKKQPKLDSEGCLILKRI